MDTLALVFIDCGGIGREGDLVGADVEGIETLVEILVAEEASELLSE